MPSLIIDGRKVEFEKGETVMQAALRVGITIPHFCWHPGLSIAANCRMCLVEGKGSRGPYPKLVPACQWPAEPDSEIFTRSEKAEDARQGVLEFYLVNHPIDCPICDQAGECKLQDYYQDHALHETRNDGAKVRKPKGTELGSTVMFDAERCVLCTRCVRFLEEVTGTAELNMRFRGDHNEITLFPGKTLENPYSLNVVDLCPVGALTSRDFRFKQRAWFMKARPSVCPGCSRGCNIFVDYSRQDHRPYRIRPRVNMDVNQYWMCDDGRWEYRRIVEERLMHPLMLVDGQLQKEGWKDSLGRAADRLVRLANGAPDDVAKESIGFVLSAQRTSEENFALVKLARDYIGISNPRLYLGERPDGDGDAFLRTTDRNPNRAGAIAAAAPTEVAPLSALVADVHSGKTRALVVLGEDLLPEGGEFESTSVLGDLDLTIAMSANTRPWHTACQVVLPLAAWSEVAGTYVNAAGLAQRFKAAHPPDGLSQAGWEIVCKLAQRMGYRMSYRSVNAVQLDMQGRAGGGEVRP